MVVRHRLTSPPVPSGTPRFLSAFYILLNESMTCPDVASCIQWLPAGNGFRVVAKDTFLKLYLPRLCRSQSMGSFVRQVNSYGFKKPSPGKFEYVHDVFKRDAPELLPTIKRRQPGKRARTRAKAPQLAAVTLERSARRALRARPTGLTAPTLPSMAPPPALQADAVTMCRMVLSALESASATDAVSAKVQLQRARAAVLGFMDRHAPGEGTTTSEDSGEASDTSDVSDRRVRRRVAAKPEPPAPLTTPAGDWGVLAQVTLQDSPKVEEADLLDDFWEILDMPATLPFQGLTPL